MKKKNVGIAGIKRVKITKRNDIYMAWTWAGEYNFSLFFLFLTTATNGKLGVLVMISRDNE